MSYLDTKVVKKDNGWHAETQFEFAGKRRLSITTYKINGKLVSNASVNKYDEGSMQHAFGLGRGGDFGRYILQVAGARGTEKAIREQHAAALTMVPEIMEQARAHYAAYPVPECFA